jgi:hypothetical protein
MLERDGAEAVRKCILDAIESGAMLGEPGTEPEEVSAAPGQTLPAFAEPSWAAVHGDTLVKMTAERFIADGMIYSEGLKWERAEIEKRSQNAGCSNEAIDGLKTRLRALKKAPSKSGDKAWLAHIEAQADLRDKLQDMRRARGDIKKAVRAAREQKFTVL